MHVYFQALLYKGILIQWLDNQERSFPFFALRPSSSSKLKRAKRFSQQ